MSEECVFCKIVAGQIPSEKVFENENFIVIRDVSPQVEGHLLVIPKMHVGNFMELDEGMYEGFLRTVADVARQEGLENFNLVVNEGRVAGQIVEHLHLHILPRVEGDGFELGV